MVIAMNRMLALVITLILYDLGLEMHAANIPFEDTIETIPLLDGRSLSGHYITTPFLMRTINEDKYSVIESEDRLFRIMQTASLDSIDAIKEFAYLQKMAAQGNIYALSFFTRLFKHGRMLGRELHELSTQSERAELFEVISKLSIEWMAATTKAKKDAILRRINSLIVMHKLFDFMLELDCRDTGDINVIISEVIETLVDQLGKNKGELADKFGISRSSVQRIYKKQALGKRATAPLSVGAALNNHAENLQAFLGLTIDEYRAFIEALRLAHTRTLAPGETTGLRHRKAVTLSKFDETAVYE